MPVISIGEHHNPSEDTFDGQNVLRFFARRWLLIVAAVVVGTSGAFAFCVLATPVYVATSEVLLDPPKQHALAKDPSSASGILESSMVDSQIPLIRSSRTLTQVAAQAHLAEDPEFSQPIGPGLLTRIIGTIRGKVDGEVTSDRVNTLDRRQTSVIARLSRAVEVARIAKSNALSITVSSKDPNKAMHLANLIGETYVKDQVADQVRSVQQIANLFEERLTSLRDQVRNSENAVSEFRKKNGLTTTTDEKITVADQQLTSLNEKLAIANSETADKLARYEQARRFASGDGDPMTLLEVVRSPVISQLRAQQAEIMRREADMKQVYGPRFPALKQIQAQRSAVNAAMDAEKGRLMSTLKNDYDVAVAHQSDIRRTMAKLSSPAGSNENVGVRLRDLERTNFANKALFENFLNRAKLTDEQPSFETPDARVISAAIMPLQPSSPKSNMIIPVGALAGLVLGLGLAAGLENMTGSRASARKSTSHRESSTAASSLAGSPG